MTSHRVETLYSYVMVADSGFAPNPHFGVCTLACCKPAIRRAIGNRLLRPGGDGRFSELRDVNPDFIRSQNIRVLGLANTLYVASERLWDTDLPGSGVLNDRSDRVLTAPGMQLSKWALLDWMAHATISYHSPRSLGEGYFQSAAKGQEFVVDPNPDATSWALSVLQ